MVGSLAAEPGVVMLALQPLDDENILHHVLRRADKSVVQQLVVQPPADFWTWPTFGKKKTKEEKVFVIGKMERLSDGGVLLSL